MKQFQALIFGCDEYAQQIAHNLLDTGQEVRLYTLHEEKIPLLEENLPDAKIALFDLSDNWEALECDDCDSVLSYCALCDEAQNVFLTISLHTAYETMPIIALASDREHATKLKMAGANKTIVTAQITANMLHEQISYPTVSLLMQNLLYDQSDLKIAQITVSKRSELIGLQVRESEAMQSHYRLILLAVIDSELQTLFAFTRKGMEYTIAEGDILIVMGRSEDIEVFREATGEHYRLDWHRWHWKDD